MNTDKDIRDAVIKYSNMLYKICIVILCNEQDVQDAIQETFVRYLEKRPDFDSAEHEKAWLIRVAVNICRDMLRFRMRHPKVSLDELENSLAAPETGETLKELMELPFKH
ncbi:MAG: sigma-70 family RNA polymerase sigma factor, partial [Clostridium sp.]|nr:sigma-70 family RNA polymerase sigma factor [Clostridium sp.]